MPIVYTKQQRNHIIDEFEGKIINKLEWTEPRDGMMGYWTYLFTDGTEMSFRFLAELI
jgi:hypothetical protein